MKRSLKRVAFAVPAIALLLVASVGSWYAFSAPPVEHLPLGGDLIAISSAEGRQLLAATAVKTDYRQLDPFLLPQIRRAFCGPATSAAVINAALRPRTRVTQSSLFDTAARAVKSELAVSFGGLTLEELAELLRAHGLHVQVAYADESDIGSFRDAAQSTLAEPRTFLVVNYDRGKLGQSGAGHISPIGAFSRDTDRLLVLDVATYKYPYTWVPVSRLWTAMNTVDPDSGRSRGYLLVTTSAASALQRLDDLVAALSAAPQSPSRESSMEINGIAHIQLTVNDLQRAIPFYEGLLSFMGMRAVAKAANGLYMVGGRTAVAIGRASDENRECAFDQRRIGLHHVCFRARSPDDIDALHAYLVARGVRIVHPPEHGSWAPGYYSVLFEDPEGIRLEVNYVPGKGHFENPGQLPLKTMPGYEDYPE